MPNSKSILTEANGQGMLIDIENGVSLFLNDTALLIYKQLNENKSREEIEKLFLEEFDVSAVEARKDIEDFITLLNKKGIVYG